MKNTMFRSTVVALLSLLSLTLHAQVNVNNSSNPLGKLHVHDPVNHVSSIYITPQASYSGDSSMIFFAEDNDASYGMFWLYSGTSPDGMELWGYSNGNMPGPYLKILRSTGNMAIGNTFGTGYKLSVNGKIICTEVRVAATSGWPDYVFEKNYPLMPIGQFAKFIETNRHLPNVPSASEIEESGLELGEMQRVMMEKIEELSLYIIQQQKEIEELREQISTSEK